MAKSLEERRAYQRAYYHRKKSETGEYYKKKRSEYYQKNKESFALRSREWYASIDNKMKVRENKHSIIFNNLYNEQGGLCAIGKEPLPNKISAIHVDHDHETGIIRGLVCQSHNVGLGMFGDDWEMLQKASEYVFKNKVRYLNEKV